MSVTGALAVSAYKCSNIMAGDVEGRETAKDGMQDIGISSGCCYRV